MANIQGRPLTDTTVKRIVILLASTDVPIAQIAERMGCSRSVVSAINRRYQIREYAGPRSSWTLQAANHEV